MRGFTLTELLAALVILGVLLGLGLPWIKEGVDRTAVVAARDATASLLARTRAVAVARGGATFVLVPDSARIRVVDRAGRIRAGLDLGEAYGVAVEAGGAAAVRLRYDALGIGRVASRTIRFRRGGAVSTLVVSSYGRVEPR